MNISEPAKQAAERFRRFRSELHTWDKGSLAEDELQECIQTAINTATAELRTVAEEARTVMQSIMTHGHTVYDDTAWTQCSAITADEWEKLEAALSKLDNLLKQ